LEYPACLGSITSVSVISFWLSRESIVTQGERDYEEFMENDPVQDEVIWNLLVIGELP